MDLLGVVASCIAVFVFLALCIAISIWFYFYLDDKKELRKLEKLYYLNQLGAFNDEERERIIESIKTK